MKLKGWPLPTSSTQMTESHESERRRPGGLKPHSELEARHFHQRKATGDEDGKQGRDWPRAAKPSLTGKTREHVPGAGEIRRAEQCEQQDDV